MVEGCVLSMQTCSTVLNPNLCGSSEVSQFESLSIPQFFNTNPYLPPRATGFQRSPRLVHSPKQASAPYYMNGGSFVHGVQSYDLDPNANSNAGSTSSNANDMPLGWKAHDQSHMHSAHHYYPSYQDNQSDTKATSPSGRPDYADRLQPTLGLTSGRPKGSSPLIVSTSWTDQPESIESSPLAQQPPVDSSFLVDQGEALDGISIWGEDFTENRYENPAVGPSRPAHPFHVFAPPLTSSSSSSSPAYRSTFGRQSYHTGSFANSTSVPTPISSASSPSTSSVNNPSSSSAHSQQAINAPFVATGPFEETTFSRYQQMFNEKHPPETRFNITPSSNVLPATRVPKDYVAVSPSIDVSVVPSAFSLSSSTPTVPLERRAPFHHHHHHHQQQQQQHHHQRRLSISDIKHSAQQASSALFSNHFTTGSSETPGSDMSLFSYDPDPNPSASGSSSILSSSPSAASLPSSLGLTPKTNSTLPTVQEGRLPDQVISSSWRTDSSIEPSSELSGNSNNSLKTIRPAQSGYWSNNPSLMYAPLSSGSSSHQQTPLGTTHSSSSPSSSASIPAQAFLGPSSSSSSPYSINTAPFRSIDDFTPYPTGPQITPEQYRSLLLGQQQLQAHQKCFNPEEPESSSSSSTSVSLTAVHSPFAPHLRHSSENHGPSLMTTTAATTIEPRSLQVGSYPPTTNVGLTNLSTMNASLPTDLPSGVSRPGSYGQARENSHQVFDWAASSSGMFNEKDPAWTVARATNGEPHEIGSGSEKGITAKRKETNQSARGGSGPTDRKPYKKKSTGGSSIASVVEGGKDLKESEAGEQADGRSDRSPAQGIKKVSLACHFCRGRKLRCDATRPTCAHCVKRGLSCTYDSIIRRRGPGKRKNGEKPLGEGLDTEGGETDE